MRERARQENQSGTTLHPSLLGNSVPIYPACPEWPYLTVIWQVTEKKFQQSRPVRKYVNCKLICLNILIKVPYRVSKKNVFLENCLFVFWPYLNVRLFGTSRTLLWDTGKFFGTAVIYHEDKLFSTQIASWQSSVCSLHKSERPWL